MSKKNRKHRSCANCGNGKNELVARTAPETQLLFAEAFARGDIDAIMPLYEKNAIVVVAPGVTVTGCDAIRQSLVDLLGLFIGMPTFTLQFGTSIQTEDVALLISTFSLSGTGLNGQPLAITGTTTDVAHRHKDRWLIAIDNPFGITALPA